MAKNRLRIHSRFLKFLPDATLQQRKFLLKTASKDQVLVLSEIIINLLNDHFQLTKQQEIQLSKYKSCLRKVGLEGRVSWIQRRKYLQKNTKALVKVLK